MKIFSVILYWFVSWFVGLIGAAVYNIAPTDTTKALAVIVSFSVFLLFTVLQFNTMKSL